MSSTDTKTSLVIGGGIVGLATAYALCSEGVHVTLIDPGEETARATTATAGIIGGSSVIPWASTELWPKVPRYLMDRDGPVRMSLPLPKKLGGFLVQSVRAGRSEGRQNSAAGLANLGLRGWDAWQSLLMDAPKARALFEQKGCSFFYGTAAQRDADRAGTVMRRSFGMDLTELSGDEMRAALPALRVPVAGGMRVNAAGHLSDPLGLQAELIAAIRAQGGRVIRQHMTGWETSRQRVVSVRTEDGATHRAETVVLCAGSGSAALARRLGRKIPMIPAWGASVTFIEPSVEVTAPVLMLNDGIAITPSKQGLRVSGLLQVGGVGNADAMIARLIRQTKRMFGDLVYARVETCAGPRPLVADSLPFLGPDPTYHNVIHNFGHGHWGLTQASISALVVSDLVTARAARIDINAYRPDRF